MVGYWDDDVKTKETITNEGWLRSGLVKRFLIIFSPNVIDFPISQLFNFFDFPQVDGDGGSHVMLSTKKFF